MTSKPLFFLLGAIFVASLAFSFAAHISPHVDAKAYNNKRAEEREYSAPREWSYLFGGFPRIYNAALLEHNRLILPQNTRQYPIRFDKIAKVW